MTEAMLILPLWDTGVSQAIPLRFLPPCISFLKILASIHSMGWFEHWPVTSGECYFPLSPQAEHRRVPPPWLLIFVEWPSK